MAKEAPKSEGKSRTLTDVRALARILRQFDLTAPPWIDGIIEAGDTWNFQFWFRDSQSPSGFHTSDAASVTFLP